MLFFFFQFFRHKVRLSSQCIFLVAWGRILLLLTSLLELILLHPIGFEFSCFHCHLFLDFFLISLLISSVACWLFRNLLFNLYVFVFLMVFFLQSISNLLVLWSEKMLDTISVFSSLLRFGLRLKTWTILQNVPCALEKVYSSAFGWNVLKISMRSSHLVYHLRLVFLYEFFILMICPLVWVGC